MNLDTIITALWPRIQALVQPVWKDWTPTLAGFSTNPTGGVYRYMLIGKTCYFSIRQATAGTSNATTMTITLPVTPATIANMSWMYPMCYVDSGSVGSTYGRLYIGSGDATAVCGKTPAAAGGFTNSGDKRIVDCSGWYEVA